MRLTNYSDYALRCLIYLAVKPDPYALCHIKDIALAYDISKSHLTKVVHQLATLGYIDSLRGKNGGIRIAKPPKDINLGEVVRLTEPDFAIVDCFSSSAKIAPPVAIKKNKAIFVELIDNNDFSRCKISPCCQLKAVFAEATYSFIKVLDRYTLADVIGNPSELEALLSQTS